MATECLIFEIKALGVEGLGLGFSSLGLRDNGLRFRI
jgi:hypothetical protein